MNYLYIFFFFIFASCSPQIHDVHLKDYIPATEGEKYTYQYDYNKKTARTETVLIKVKMENQQDVFCFVAPDETKSSNPTLASCHFLEGIFCFSGDTIKIAPRFTLLEPDTASIYNQFNPFFGPAVNINDSIILKVTPEIIYTYKISEFEKVKTPAGKFHCIKIDYTKYDLVPMNMRGDDFVTYQGIRYPAFSKSASAWIAKDVGMVKWKRFTGRVDLLTEYSNK